MSLISAWLLTVPGHAQAPDESALAAARQLGQDGVALYEHGDFASASNKLERAYAVVKVPTLGLWSGRALEKLGKLVEAMQRFKEVTLIALKPSDPKVLHDAQNEAKNGYDALAPRIAQLTIDVDGTAASDVSVTVDDKPVPNALIGAALPVNPGPHRVEGRRGQEVMREAVTLAEGEQHACKLVFAAVVASAPVPTPQEVAARTAQPNSTPSTSGGSGHRTSVLPWVMVGIGGAAAVTGVVFVAMALGAKANVEGVAQDTTWAAIRSDYNRVPTFSATGFALLGFGAATMAAGLVWKFGTVEQNEGGLSISASPARVALKGTY